jgi:hypothetical protein
VCDSAQTKPKHACNELNAPRAAHLPPGWSLPSAMEIAMRTTSHPAPSRILVIIALWLASCAVAGAYIFMSRAGG